MEMKLLQMWPPPTSRRPAHHDDDELPEEEVPEEPNFGLCSAKGGHSQEAMETEEEEGGQRKGTW